ncbi:MAG: peptidase S41 [Bacteroidetes bacterium]|nr:MAG: peptidase S41 [Bacteroidota bacterium]
MNRFKKVLKIIRNLIIVLSIAFTSIVSFSFVNNFVDNDFELAKNLDIFASMYRELNIYYVDDIKPAKLMRSAIDSMLETLDPYTDFISETEIEDYRFMTTGQYGGIGSVISKDEDYVIITEPYEGYPAQKADLRAGDKIIEINGKPAVGKSVDAVSKILKGTPNTEVTIVIQRPGEEINIEKTLMREKIRVDNVPFYGMVNDSIGYINLRGFTQGAGKEVKVALTKLKEENTLKGVILDLRYNPGGLLNEAVNVSNVFIKKGLEVVRTKGKVSEWDKIHKATNNPVDPDIPLAVLINSNSASASEIVSGVIQDYDRGIILGERSYGKGLVQSTRPLSYNTQLKLTTAKYYIPSGRCIQALDYSNRNEDGSIGKVPDSLITKFNTQNGRAVYDGGGINPDFKVKKKVHSNILVSLMIKRVIFDFATFYRNTNESLTNPEEFEITEELWNSFISFINDKEYDYTTKSEKALETFKKNSKKEEYFENVLTEFEALETKVKHNKEADINRYKEDICHEIKAEIISRYYYRKGRIQASFENDNVVQEAVSKLSDKDNYYTTLGPLAKVSK